MKKMLATAKPTKQKKKNKTKQKDPQNQTISYLIGAADQFKDVHLGMRLSIISEKRVQVWDWGQSTVLIGNTV